MNWITVYWTCLLLGFIWLSIQILLADFGQDFGHVDIDPGAIDVDVDGVHLDHVDVYGMGEIHLSPVSPMIISGFITIFGAAGVIVENTTGLGSVWIALIAVGAGFAGAAVLWVLLSAIIRAVCGSSEARIGEIVGHEAEVITPIRGSGVGEIAYVQKGSRYNSPARSIDKTDIERNQLVKIVRIVGPTYFVRELTQEELEGIAREADNPPPREE